MKCPEYAAAPIAFRLGLALAKKLLYKKNEAKKQSSPKLVVL